MRFDVLGTLQVTRDGVDVTPRGKHPRGALAVLLRHRGDTGSPDTLLELVWPAEADRFDASGMHTVVSRLRSKLGKDSVGTSDGGYFRPTHFPSRRTSPAAIRCAHARTSC